MEITIPYSPREWTKPLHDGTERWKVIVCHRRAGKTVASVNHLIRDALITSGSRYAYIAPTYKQAKNIAWDILKHYSRPIPGAIFNESELRADYPNGSRITLFGADNPDSLRGLGFWGVVFDEYSQQPSNIFSEIIRPTLADKGGYAIWVGTPKGKNDFYRLYETAKQQPNWLAMLRVVDDTNILSKEELDDARITMSEDEFQQEFYCSWEASIKGAYYADQIAQARKEGRITKVPHDPALKVHTWWDLGVADSTTILFFQHIGKEWRIIDCYEQSGESLAHYAQILEKKPYNYGYHWAPHDIEVTELGSGKSRKSVAKSLGIDFSVAPNLQIHEGIHSVRMRFHELWIDEMKCAPFLDAILSYHKEWDDKRGEFKNKPLHDWSSHFADALRYWAVTNFERKEQGTKQFRPNWQGPLKRGGIMQSNAPDVDTVRAIKRRTP